MKKKELVKKLSELVDSHNLLQRCLEVNEREKGELKGAIDLLNAQLEAERQKNCELTIKIEQLSRADKIKTESAYQPESKCDDDFAVTFVAGEANPENSLAEEITEEGQSFTESGEETSAPVITEASAEIKPTAQIETEKEIIVELPPLVNEAVEYGSVAIGKIICESVKATRTIGDSVSENKKELLNLIMGKGEIAKNEIFNITESDVSAEAKRELIDAQVVEAIDYFKSVAEQL